jgi:four helix bundle protein
MGNGFVEIFKIFKEQNMRNFRELDIWKLSRGLVNEIYFLMKIMPEEEKFGLTSQIKRSVISIPSNIAEGCAKKSYNDFSRYLEISLGSCYELETQLILCSDVELISEEIIDNKIILVQTIEKKITSFINYLATQ